MRKTNQPEWQVPCVSGKVGEGINYTAVEAENPIEIMDISFRPSRHHVLSYSPTETNLIPVSITLPYPPIMWWLVA